MLVVCSFVEEVERENLLWLDDQVSMLAGADDRLFVEQRFFAGISWSSGFFRPCWVKLFYLVFL